VTRTYAIGDIHGQLDKLVRAHALIAADRRVTGDTDAPVVHLGDLVDRGPESAEVIEYLMAGPARGGPWIAIRGNHDGMFLAFLDDHERRDPRLSSHYTWLHPRLGGLATLQSYGIGSAPDLAQLHARAVACVPGTHRAWLAACGLTMKRGPVFSVHAGTRPGVPLDRQDPGDLVWIREPFLSDTRDHGPLIVHGHSVVDVPEHRGNRVNLDTGAGFGRNLSVAVIEGRDVALLTDRGRRPLLAP